MGYNLLHYIRNGMHFAYFLKAIGPKNNRTGGLLFLLWTH